METKLLLGGIGVLLLDLVLRAVWKRRLFPRLHTKQGQERDTSPVSKSERRRTEVLEWCDTIFSALFMAAFIMYFFVQAFKIPSGSMKPGLLIGDHLFVNKFIYGTRVPLTEKKIMRLKHIKHGDVVVFQFPATDKDNTHFGKDFIKRAIGLPGDTVEIRNKQVYVNGDSIDEPYVQHTDRITHPRYFVFNDAQKYQAEWEAGQLSEIDFRMIRDNFGPVTVPANSYFVLGDNRDHSFDSRFWGPLNFEKLRGKAMVIYWPPGRIGLIR